jgi:hypothetical protein
MELPRGCLTSDCARAAYTHSSTSMGAFASFMRACVRTRVLACTRFSCTHICDYSPTLVVVYHTQMRLDDQQARTMHALDSRAPRSAPAHPSHTHRIRRSRSLPVTHQASSLPALAACKRLYLISASCTMESAHITCVCAVMQRGSLDPG